MNVDWSIQEVARLAGTTSRTLRHYGELGLLPPSRVGSNGYRYYDQRALARLQRILILKRLGLGLADTARVLAGEEDDVAALERHLVQLGREQERIEAQMVSVATTITALREGAQLMAEDMLDGFDHTEHKEEVEERWGAQAYADGDRWWRSLSEAERAAFQQTQRRIAEDFASARRDGLTPDSPEVQAVMDRHVAWLGLAPVGRAIDADYVVGLGEMYVADPRFARNYDRHEPGTAELVRDASRVWAGRSGLSPSR